MANLTGTNVNYNVNWTYGGDGSKKGGGYAALHGCQGDTVTFQFAGGPHNVVELDYSVARSEHPTLALSGLRCGNRCSCDATVFASTACAPVLNTVPACLSCTFQHHAAGGLSPTGDLWNAN